MTTPPKRDEPEAKDEAPAVTIARYSQAREKRLLDIVANSPDREKARFARQSLDNDASEFEMARYILAERDARKVPAPTPTDDALTIARRWDAEGASGTYATVAAHILASHAAKEAAREGMPEVVRDVVAAAHQMLADVGKVGADRNMLCRPELAIVALDAQLAAMTAERDSSRDAARQFAAAYDRKVADCHALHTALASAREEIERVKGEKREARESMPKSLRWATGVRDAGYQHEYAFAAMAILAADDYCAALRSRLARLVWKVKRERDKHAKVAADRKMWRDMMHAGSRTYGNEAAIVTPQECPQRHLPGHGLDCSHCRGSEVHLLDNCRMCLGAKGNVLGNENVIGGVTCCDDCSVLMGESLTSTRAEVEALRGAAARASTLLGRAAGCLMTVTDEVEAMAETLGEDEEETRLMVQSNRHNVGVFQDAADELRTLATKGTP